MNIILYLNKKLVRDNEHLKKLRIVVNSNRNKGNKQKYKIGSIFKFSADFLLTAFAMVDDENRVYLTKFDYFSFLLSFWKEIDIIYNGKDIAITVFGSGITRFSDGYSPSIQELLEFILWSFKFSGIKLMTCLKVIIPLDKCDEIDFYKLKELE
jgi:hypothetical protein